MKYQLCFLFLIVSLFTCKEEEKKVDTFSPKIDKLAKRYEALGRFSGTILIAQKDKILFNQSYGFADYEKSIRFSDTTIFKIGMLTELFTDHITPQESDATQKIIKHYCLKHGLKHTFFQRENRVIAQGYLFHNYREQGIELEKIQYDKKEEGSRKFELKSTALDLLKFAQLLPYQAIQKSGYISDDGFSYTFQKNKNLTIIILSNRRHPIGEEMATSIQAIYENRPYELPLLRVPVIANTNLYSNYIGTYQVNPTFNFEVIVKNDSLFTVMGGQETVIIPQSDDQFYYQDFDAAIRFVSDSNRVVSKAILYDGFIKGKEVIKIKS